MSGSVSSPSTNSTSLNTGRKPSISIFAGAQASPRTVSPLANTNSTISSCKKRPSFSFQAAGKTSAPAPVSTNIPAATDLPSSKGLEIAVCAMIRPMPNPKAWNVA